MSVHDLYECPSDPQEQVRERVRHLLIREPMPDPRASVSDPAPVSAIIAGRVLRATPAAVALGLLIALFWAGLNPS